MSMQDAPRNLALLKHGGQIYKGGGSYVDEPYSNHLARVAAHFPYSSNIRARIEQIKKESE